MGLVSYENYSESYMGEPVSAADFPRSEKRAEVLILNLINKTADEVISMPEVTFAAVQMAICCQIDYLYEYGITVASYGKEAGGGFTVGKVSVHNGSASKAEAGAKSMIAPGVFIYLERTGLLNPAVGTAPEPWPATRGWMA